MRTHFQQTGLSLIELMVAMVIGMVSMLVLMQVGVVAEGQKRTTVGGAGSVDATTVALSMISRDLKMAGFSLNHPDVIGCQLTAYREADGSAIAATLLPADITQGGAGASDVLNIRAGDTRRFSEADLFSNHPGDATPFITGGNYGFLQGDVFLVVESGVANCVLAEVSGAPPDNTQVLHAAGATRFNNPAGTVIAFTGAARLTNLGPNPTLVRYSVNAGNLQRQELMANTTDTILSGVITLQTQYGFNVTGAGAGAGLTWSDTIIDADGDTTVGDDDDWLQLTAIRVAVMIRHDKYEKPDSAGNCDTSPASVAWSFGSFDVSALPDGRCYRYDVAETIVPLRNLIWSPS